MGESREGQEREMLSVCVCVCVSMSLGHACG